MASFPKHKAWANNPDVVVIHGSFAPAGAGAPTDQKGRGFTVAHSATGKFTITFTKQYQHMLSAVATVQHNTDNTDLTAQFGVYTAASRTLVLKTKAAGTNTDITADADNRVNFSVAFQNTTQSAT